MTALKCIDEGLATGNPEMFDVARTYVKDIITMASAIGQQGSIDRVYARNPELAKIIKHKDDDNVLTPQTLQEIKEYKEANPAHKFLYAAGRTASALFVAAIIILIHHLVEVISIIEISIIITIIISFFEQGERIPIVTPSPPKELPAEFPRKLSREQEKRRIWSKNQLKSLMDRETSWTYYQRAEIFKALAVYLGSFIGLVWYYAEFSEQGESNGVFQTEQKIYRGSPKLQKL
jgi:hypothetical protein